LFIKKQERELEMELQQIAHNLQEAFREECYVERKPDQHDVSSNDAQKAATVRHLGRLTAEVGDANQKNKLERRHLEGQREQLRNENLKLRRDLDNVLKEQQASGLLNRITACITPITKCPNRKNRSGGVLDGGNSRGADYIAYDEEAHEVNGGGGGEKNRPMSQFHDKREDL
jgi:hypothetical protein